MKKFFKRTMCLVMATTSVFAVTACNGGGNGGQFASDGKPYIKLSYYKGGYGEKYMNTLVENFNNLSKEGKYDFYVQAMPDPDISATLTNQIANADNGAEVPDVAITCSIPLQSWAVQGYAYDITDVATTEVSASKFEGGVAQIKDKIDPALSERICYDGKYYGIPMQGAVTGILYNKKLLKELTGSEEAPKTMADIWDIQEIVESCTRNQNSSSADNITTFIYPSNATGYFQYFYYSHMAQQLGYDGFYDLYDLVDIDNRMNEDYYKEVYENTFENLGTLGQPTTPTGSDPMYHIASTNTHTICLTAFTKNKGVFTPCGDWSYNEVVGINPDAAQSNFGLATIPLICDTTTKKVIAKATASSEVFAGVDTSDANAVAAVEEKYTKLERAKVADSVIPEGDESAEYIYFPKFSYSTGADVYALVPYGSKNVERAKQFLTYLATDEALQTFTRYTGSYLPYVYDVPEEIMNTLPKFSAECVAMTSNVNSIYMASTNKAVGYSLVGMSSCSNPNFYANLVVWKTADRPAKLAQDLYQDFKARILKDHQNIETKIRQYERNFGKV